MKWAVIAGLLAACVHTAGNAAVRYSFSGSTEHAAIGGGPLEADFSVVLSDFVSAPVLFGSYWGMPLPIRFSSCSSSAPGGCDWANFAPDETSEGSAFAAPDFNTDIVTFTSANRPVADMPGFFTKDYHWFYFEVGAFQSLGSHASVFGDAATLTVENVVDDVPEPASWAMIMAGFGAIGAAMRGRRRLAFGPAL